jgi:fatty acid synthase subunit beta
MTYEEVALRTVKLIFVDKEGGWVDISLRTSTGNWLRRVEASFAGVKGGRVKASICQSYNAWGKPLA